MLQRLERSYHQRQRIGYDTPVLNQKELKHIDPNTYYALTIARTISWLANESNWSGELSFHAGLCGGLGCERGVIRRSHHDVDIALAETDIGFIGKLAHYLGQQVYRQGKNIYRVMIPVDRLEHIGGPKEQIRYKKVGVDFTVLTERDGHSYYNAGTFPEVYLGTFPFHVETGQLLGEDLLFLHKDVLTRLKAVEAQAGREKSRFDLESLKG